MEDERFDAMARVLGQGRSRRGVLGLLAVTAGLSLREVSAKATHHRKGKGKGKRKPHHGGNKGATPTCGKAGEACSAATPPCCGGLRCSNGACRKASSSGGCAPDQVKCKGACTDVQSDPKHCGMCGHSCQGGASCQQGQCATCATGLTTCNGQCIDTQTDAANCGSCGQACPGGAACRNGSCQVTCDPGATNCQGTCVDTQTDNSNCGGCGRPCSGRTNTCCGGTCVDLANNLSHCGACGNHCPSCNGVQTTCETSIDGSSICTGSGTCRPCTSDADCTAIGTGARCVVGDPSSTDCATVCENQCLNSSCSPGWTDCNGTCRDLAHDPDNCGACGAACPAVPNTTAVTCYSGTCFISTCADGFADCNQTFSDGCETDLRNDSANCGDCGNRCNDNDPCTTDSCSQGTCQHTPATGEACDSGAGPGSGTCDANGVCLVCGGAPTDVCASTKTCAPDGSCLCSTVPDGTAFCWERDGSVSTCTACDPATNTGCPSGSICAPAPCCSDWYPDNPGTACLAPCRYSTASTRSAKLSGAHRRRRQASAASILTGKQR